MSRPPSSTLLEGAAAVYTCDADRVLPNGWVLVRDGAIAEVGGGSYAGPEPEERIDLGGCILTPGLVNTHHHFFQTLTRAIPRTQRTGILDWLYGMYPLWAGLDAEASYWAALATSAELLLTGATTCADFAYLLPGDDGMLADGLVRGAREAGIRFHFVRGCMPTIEGDLETQLKSVMGDRLGHLLDDPEVVFTHMKSTVDRHHDTSWGSMCRVAVGPTGVTYAQPGFMRRIADFARDHHSQLHTHFHPRPDERVTAREQYGSTPLDVLRDAEWLRPGTWFAHCTQLTDDEMQAFADTGVGVSHCPRCIMRLGLPVTRIGTMREKGVVVGIGVDGGASNDSGAMLNEVRLALVLHRVDAVNRKEGPDRWLTPHDALLMATRDGARLLQRDDVGVIAPGKRADLAAFRIDRLSCVGAVSDPLGALLMAGADPYAALTMVDGRIRVRDGRLVDLDELAIAREADRHARRLIERAEKLTGMRFDHQPEAV